MSWLNAPVRSGGAAPTDVGELVAPEAGSWGSSRTGLFGMLAAFGPGLVAMLADTDAGSLLTAAQSGSRWGDALVLPELALIPVLYLVQEMTVRLGLVTGRGHGELIREHFGARWAVCSSITLLASALGALLTEFVGVAAAAALFGVPRLLSVPVAAAVLISLAFTGRYRRVERVALAFGLAELLFVPVLVLARPHLSAIVSGLHTAPLGQRSYLYLLAANVGAVIMPWMIFYQQGAVIQRGLRVRSLRAERLDPALGTIATQVVMVTVVLLATASLWHRGGGPSLSGVTQLAAALHPELGPGSRFVIGAAVIGAAMVAAVVVSLAGSWGLAEALGMASQLERPPRAGERPVLRDLCRRPSAWGGDRAQLHQPRPTRRRGRGDERRLAAGGAWLSPRTGGPGAPGRLSHAWRPPHRGHLLLRRRDALRAGGRPGARALTA